MSDLNLNTSFNSVNIEKKSTLSQLNVNNQICSPDKTKVVIDNIDIKNISKGIPTLLELKGNTPSDTVGLTRGPSRDIDLKGTFKGGGLINSVKIPAELRQFNPDCSPATLHIELDGKGYDCKLHIRQFYFKGLTLATLEIPDELLNAGTKNAVKVVNDAFDNKKYIPLRLEQKDNMVEIHNTFKSVSMEFNLPKGL